MIIKYAGERIEVRGNNPGGEMSEIGVGKTDLASPPIQSQQEIEEQVKSDIENSGNLWKVNKEQLLQNFLLFAILILGMTVKPFHKRWAEFMLGRKRSLILAPRDHGKSWILTIAYCIWRIVKDPNIRILIVSNSAGMAQGFLSAIRSHLERNKMLIGIFGKFKGPAWTNDAITVCQRTKTGLPQPTVTTVGVYGSLISGHYDLVIGDDIVDFENSRTKTQRDKLWNWFWTVVFPTLETNEKDPSRDGELTLRGTRYHADDMYGRMIGEVEQYKPGSFKDSYIRDEALRGNNTALWPERKSRARLIEIKQDVGSVIFALQYQNDASLTIGRIFGPSYFQKTWKTLPEPEDLLVLAGYDLAVSEKEESDFFAEAVVGIHRKTKDIYLLDVWRQHLTAPKQFDAIRNSYEKWRWSRGGVEDVAYQKALVQWLKQNTAVPVKGIHRHKDKVTRALAIVSHFENGKFYMPADRRFADFVDEMCLFPDGDHDDLFDALEICFDLALGKNSGSFKYFFV